MKINIQKLTALITALVVSLSIGPDLLVVHGETHETIEPWTIDSNEEWTENSLAADGLKFVDGLAQPTKEIATLRSIVRTFPEKRAATSVIISQSPIWENWQSAGHIGPTNLADAPILLRHGPDDYWIFGRYRGVSNNQRNKEEFVAVPVQVDGFEVPLQTTPFPNQYDAPGGLKRSLGGYHAWQSRDMVNWVHHGPVSDAPARWMTSAEKVGDKTYLYYDFPNDQDPHLIIDEDLTDGQMGMKMGMAIKDPSHGSDSGIIRDLDGKFHLIIENWDPINASARSWDSPLASHAASDNGIDGFKLLDPAVDHRTQPTGTIQTYKHPHWNKEDPENYPTNIAEYEVHEPVQNAYGDWAAIAIGGQYYLFGDFDPAGAHGRESMSVGWFTSSSIYEPFTWCSNIGKGHPDPDIIFAEGRFYLVTQNEDFVSPGPWVNGVEVRVGVDTDNDESIDQWTDWQTVAERYEAIPDFAKHVSKTPAKLDLDTLPAGYGFQFEIRLTDSTANDSKPILDQVRLNFSP